MAVLPRIAALLGTAPARAWALAVLVGTTLSLAGAPATAQARVEKVLTKGGGPEITVGLQPREGQYYWDAGVKGTGLNRGGAVNGAISSFGNAEGHEVVHAGAVNTYAIYWDPSDYYHGDWQGLINGFLSNLGESNGALGTVFAIDGQYTDTTNKPAATRSRFRGAYTDTHPYPESGNCADPEPEPWEVGVPFLEASPTIVCLTDAQVKAELERFLKQREEEHFTLSKGMGTIFYLMTPPGVTVCLDQGGASGHCSTFDGKPREIAEFEEREGNYPEELEKYEEEKAKYEKELKTYEANKENFTKKSESDPETAPVAPKKPSKPVEPASYADYKKSFCSYHGVIGSGSNAILYGMIPWTAGSEGDFRLPEQAPGFACQDGGFEPKAKATGETEEKEHEKPESLKEKEEFEQAPAKQKREHQEAEEDGLAKPHDQEPNQLGEVGPDGYYDTGLADLIIGQIAAEQQDIVTDPLLNAWKDSEGNEVTDECRNFFVPATGTPTANPNTKAGSLSNQVFGRSYLLGDAYNLAAAQRAHPGKEFPGLPYPGVPCLNGVSLDPSFTVPSVVKGGESVGFDGMESVITLGSSDKFSGGSPARNYATYTWNFGDGNRGDSTPEVSGYAPGAPACEEPWLSTCAASEFHTYKYTGTYEVTLTVTDVAGDRATATRFVTVEGEPWPETPGSSTSPPVSTSGSAPAGATAPATGASTTGAKSGGLAATATIASKTLSSVLRSGLAVRYTVNQQVAGHFEVLLAAAVAHRVGLRGSTVAGLAKGTPPQIMIGKAILDTTAGGGGTIKIQFGKVTAKRLRRLGKVTLMLRLIVRNAKAQTATVLTSASLGR